MESFDLKAVWSSVTAFFIAILSGLGVGSGGLLVIWLTMVEGMDAIGARGLNLLFFIFSASAALIFHILRKRLRYKLVIFMALFACAGTAVGSYVGAYISSDHLRKFFGFMLIISGGYTIVTRIFAKLKKGGVRKAEISQNSTVSQQK